MLVVALVAIGVSLAVGLSRGGSSTPATTTKPKPPPPPPPPPPKKARLSHRRPQVKAAVARFVRLGRPIYCGGHRGRYIALTLDDGPGPYTEQSVLPLLRRSRARATFFVVGQRIGARALRTERMLGTVGNHTWTHPLLTALGAGSVTTQLSETQRAIERATGRQPNVFRPPYGARNATVDAAARSLGLAEILWSIDSYDSRGYSTRNIGHTVLKLVQPGAIILMHDTIPATVKALPKILRVLKHRKFKLVTVPELLALDPPSLTQLRAGFEGCYSGAAPRFGRD